MPGSEAASVRRPRCYPRMAVYYDPVPLPDSERIRNARQPIRQRNELTFETKIRNQIVSESKTLHLEPPKRWACESQLLMEDSEYRRQRVHMKEEWRELRGELYRERTRRRALRHVKSDGELAMRSRTEILNSGEDEVNASVMPLAAPMPERVVASDALSPAHATVRWRARLEAEGASPSDLMLDNDGIGSAAAAALRRARLAEQMVHRMDEHEQNRRRYRPQRRSHHGGGYMRAQALLPFESPPALYGRRAQITQPTKQEGSMSSASLQTAGTQISLAMCWPVKRCR